MNETNVEVNPVPEAKLEVRKSTLKRIFSWTIRNLKFMLIPMSRIKDLSARQFEFEKIKSKRNFLQRLRSPLTILGIGLIFFIVTLAVFAPWLSPYTFKQLTAFLSPAYGPMSPAHPFGTGESGRDILGRCIYGARSSLTIALPAILISVITGVIFGIIAGYYGRWIDTLIMRITDVLLAFPPLIFALVLVGAFGPKIEMIIAIYGLLGAPFYARLVRGSVLQAKELPYVEAARVMGASNWRIMFRHILPNCISPVIISFSFDIGGIILGLAGLSFLGFGDQRLIEWGNDINKGRFYLYAAPWASFFPGLMIFITVLAFMLVGDGLRDAFDPRLKNL
ncbi:MAG: ABC-type dipeptide/oligopeptide/nickel transport system, permease component [Promethearchaeota archaeon CR_4]|nr:MAG: ABC-type dipeptide/oligopeptide/nickel transport system, permease component [Candidatus Lokiarchaeota archaeon CR_4]